MNLQDALFNWLQMKIVSEARPDDRAARDTLDFFSAILKEDHGLKRVEIEKSDESFYYVGFAVDDRTEIRKFDREMADQLLLDINANPKFNS